MPKIKDLHGAIDEIEEALRLADEEVDHLIKIHHPKHLKQDEYINRIIKK